MFSIWLFEAILYACNGIMIMNWSWLKCLWLLWNQSKNKNNFYDYKYFTHFLQSTVIGCTHIIIIATGLIITRKETGTEVIELNFPIRIHFKLFHIKWEKYMEMVKGVLRVCLFVFHFAVHQLFFGTKNAPSYIH